MTKRALIATIITCSTVLAGCSNQPPAAPSKVDQAVQLQVDPPRVTLIDAGAAPLQQLKYRDSGAEQKIALAMIDGFQQSTGKAGDRADQPPANNQTSRLAAQVTAKTSGSDRRDVKLEFSQPSGGSADDNAGLDGFQLGWVANPAGRADTVTIASPKQATDKARASAERHAKKILAQPVIFPDQPVGNGAKWSVENRVTGDSTMLRTSTYTVRGIDGDKVDLDVEISERPALSALVMDGQAGTAQELKVLSAQSSSKGQLTLNLTRPLPTAGSVRIDTRIRYGGEGSDVVINQDVTSGLEFS